MKFLVMVAAVAVSGILLVPTLAHARQGDNSGMEQVSATVRYNPEDLRTPEGAARFQKRVDSAIKVMCARGRENMPSMIADTRNCIAGARQAAGPDVQLALAQ